MKKAFNVIFVIYLSNVVTCIFQSENDSNENNPMKFKGQFQSLTKNAIVGNKFNLMLKYPFLCHLFCQKGIA